MKWNSNIEKILILFADKLIDFMAIKKKQKYLFFEFE